MTLLLDFAVVDPSQSLAFPMNVIALLPYMVQVSGVLLFVTRFFHSIVDEITISYTEL